MATSTIFTNIELDNPKKIEKFIDAVERSSEEHIPNPDLRFVDNLEEASVIARKLVIADD